MITFKDVSSYYFARAGLICSKYFLIIFSYRHYRLRQIITRKIWDEVAFVCYYKPGL